MAGPVLTVEDLHTEIALNDGAVHAVDGVSFTVRRGELLGIVGESGCGKTMTALSIMRLLPAGGRIVDGRVLLGDEDITALSDRDVRAVRGKRIGMVFQDPMTSLNPTMRIGKQVAEAAGSEEEALKLLTAVGIPEPKRRFRAYPHELSGGLRQRVMIAIAIAGNPELIIADEPTTALDVTVQAQIMSLLRKLQEDRGTAIVLITHDLGVVAGHADRVLVMYAGRVAETAGADALFHAPRHPYTLGLLTSLARLDRRRTDRLRPIPGQPPSLIRVPPGCPFHPRCAFATDICSAEVPPLTGGPAHAAACHHQDRVAEARAQVVEA